MSTEDQETKADCLLVGFKFDLLILLINWSNGVTISQSENRMRTVKNIFAFSDENPILNVFLFHTLIPLLQPCILNDVYRNLSTSRLEEKCSKFVSRQTVLSSGRAGAS